MTMHWTILVTLAPMAAAIVWIAPSLRGDAPEAEASTDIVEPGAVLNAEDGVLIGTLRGRGFAVHLLTNDRYSIEDEDGRLVGIGLTVAEFADQFPDLYGETQEMLAAEPMADVDRYKANLNSGFELNRRR